MEFVLASLIQHARNTRGLFLLEPYGSPQPNRPRRCEVAPARPRGRSQNLEDIAENFGVPQTLIDAINTAGLTLVRELSGYRLMKLGKAVADTSKLPEKHPWLSSSP